MTFRIKTLSPGDNSINPINRIIDGHKSFNPLAPAISPARRTYLSKVERSAPSERAPRCTFNTARADITGQTAGDSQSEDHSMRNPVFMAYPATTASTIWRLGNSKVTDRPTFTMRTCRRLCMNFGNTAARRRRPLVSPASVPADWLAVAGSGVTSSDLKARPSVNWRTS
jgi:hypothetical protein